MCYIDRIRALQGIRDMRISQERRDKEALRKDAELQRRLLLAIRGGK
jgi:hypothetical protein